MCGFVIGLIVGLIGGGFIMALAGRSGQISRCEECERPRMCAEPGCKRVAVQRGHWCIEHIGPHL